MCGSRRAFVVAAIMALIGLALMVALGPTLMPTGQGPTLAAIFAVATAFGLGHLLAQVVGDRRLAGLLQAARPAPRRARAPASKPSTIS